MYRSASSSAVPARPAPAPPPPQNVTTTGNPHRYTPTTNWDDSPFDAQPSRKVPPPRPPPPRVQPSPAPSDTSSAWSTNSNGNNGKSKGGLGLPFKKATPHSVNILSNLFGSRGSSSSNGGSKSSVAGPKLPPPPPVAKKHHHNVQATTTRVSTVPLQSSMSNATTASELIDWSSPTSSPTLTHKTFNSDCISVDSFSSETHSNSSPQNGSYYSQAESGFEDDFSVPKQQPQQQTQNVFQPQFDLRKSVSNQISLMDPFSAPPLRSEGAKIRQVPVLPPPPVIAQKPKIIDQSAFYTSNSISFQPSAAAACKPFDDPLSNGKSLIAPAPTISMPTIIKPVILAKPVGIPQKEIRPKGLGVNKLTVMMKRESSEEDVEEKTPSPPMPIYAPPPPPPEYYEMTQDVQDDDLEQQESYGIALYDYESEHDGDLNFRANDKIYLVRQETEEWMFGRCKRGCEGLFPVNYVEIKVPLTTKKQGPNQSIREKTNAYVPPPQVALLPEKKKQQQEPERKCRALYDFNAETEEDLTISEGDFITVIGQLNEEWLLGRKKNGTQGQFPSAFVEYL